MSNIVPFRLTYRRSCCLQRVLLDLRQPQIHYRCLAISRLRSCIYLAVWTEARRGQLRNRLSLNRPTTGGPCFDSLTFACASSSRSQSVLRAPAREMCNICMNLHEGVVRRLTMWLMR